MSDANMLYAFACGEDLVRASHEDGLQVVRNGVERLVADLHPNHRVSASRDGVVVFHDGYSPVRLDLREADPEPETLPLRGIGMAVHPDGDRVLAFDTDTQTLSWEWFDGRRDPLVTLTRPNLLNYPEVALADDGETWALLDGEDVALGRGGRLTAYVHLDAPMDFYPRIHALEPALDRLVLSGSGLLAVSLSTGETGVSARDRTLASPVTTWGDATVAVAREAGGPPYSFQVVRMDPRTLEPIGLVEPLGRWQDDAPRAGLLALGDGSLVAVPGVGALRVLPAEGTSWTSGPLVTVVGAPAAPATLPSLGELAERIRTETVERRRDSLLRDLVDADTDEALALVGALARELPALHAAVEQQCLLVSEDGQVVRRFAGRGADLTAGAGPEPGPLPRGVDCAAGPFALRTIDLSQLPGDPLSSSPARTQQFLVSDCEECDEPDVDYVLEADVLLGAYDGGRLRPPTATPACAGHPYGELPAPTGAVGQRGGRPDWVQSPAVPTCPRCGTLAFFVGQLGPRATGDDSTLYGFHCERCGIAIQLQQRT